MSTARVSVPRLRTAFPLPLGKVSKALGLSTIRPTLLQANSPMCHTAPCKMVVVMVICLLFRNVMLSSLCRLHSSFFSMIPVQHIFPFLFYAQFSLCQLKHPCRCSMDSKQDSAQEYTKLLHPKKLKPFIFFSYNKGLNNHRHSDFFVRSACRSLRHQSHVQ